MQYGESQRTFAGELERVLNETDTSIRRLARLTGISRRTLENWLYGHSLRPRHVEHVLQIAHALHLPAQETDRLLLSAKHPPLAKLRQDIHTMSEGTLLDWQLAPYALRGQKNASLPVENNLPAAATPFLGRQAMCEELLGLTRSPDIRLVTVTGLGGAGKTRLALEIARTLVGRYDHGVYFIPLDNISGVDGFWEAILDGLHIPYDGASLPQQLVLNYLHDKQILLVLDNFEHLLHTTAEVTQLLSSTQRLNLLITSRQPLDLCVEQQFPIGGLSYRDGPDSPAYQLYAQTARRHVPDYEPSGQEQRDIEALASAVDGLPLALELAATWRDVFSPKQVLVHLQTDLQQVRHQAGDRPTRHHNLWNLFDYSWQLLPKEERQAAMRLSVLLGTFSSEMALAVAECHPEVLKRLVQSSFLERTRGSRLTLHPLIRQFLAEQAAETGYAVTELENRFMDVILTWTSDQSSRLRQTFKADYLQNLHAEWQHIERAWWLAVDRRRYELLESCWDLLFYFEARGTWGQGYAFFEATRKQLPTVNQRMQARLDEAQAFLSVRLLELPRAIRLAKRSLRTLDELGIGGQNDDAGKYAQMILLVAEYSVNQTAFSDDDKAALRKLTSGYLTKFAEIALSLHDGVVASNSKAYDKASQAFQKTLQLGGHDAYVMPILRCFLGISLRCEGQNTLALKQVTLALARAHELDIYPAVVGATYELRLLQGDNPSNEQCRQTLEQLAQEMGSRRTVGHVALNAAIQYLNLGLTQQARQLTRIGIGMLWNEVDTAERARILSTIAQTYIGFGLIKTAPQLLSWVTP